MTAIDVKVTIDTGDIERKLYHAAEQVPFALMVALNRTGDDANAAIRRRVEREFIIRDKRLVRYIAPVVLPAAARATKQKPRVVLETEGRARILAPFETGDPKVARSLVSPVAIPTHELRFTERTIVPRRWYPHNLGLTPIRDPGGAMFYALGRGSRSKHRDPFHRTSRGAIQIKGKQRTFVLDPTHHRGVSPAQWGVYVRIGPERGDIRMLWRYVRQVPRPRVLGFERTASEMVADRWPINADGAVALALRTARLT